MLTYDLETKTVVNKDMRKPENRKSDYLDYYVPSKTMNDLEKEYLDKHIMYDDYRKIPEDFEFECFACGFEKGIYKGKHVIIKEHIDTERKTAFVKIMEFKTEDECDDVFFFITDNR